MGKRTWSPDERDIAIVAALTELTGKSDAVFVRSDLAERVCLPVPALVARLRWLCLTGYLRREPSAPQGHARYVVIKEPSKDDVLDRVLYSRASSRLDPQRASEVVERYRKGATIKDLMEAFTSSYASIRGVLEEAQVDMRPRGRRTSP
jgi:helix-turn-helix protein